MQIQCNPEIKWNIEKRTEFWSLFWDIFCLNGREYMRNVFRKSSLHMTFENFSSQKMLTCFCVGLPPGIFRHLVFHYKKVKSINKLNNKFFSWLWRWEKRKKSLMSAHGQMRSACVIEQSPWSPTIKQQSRHSAAQRSLYRDVAAGAINHFVNRDHPSDGPP